MWQRKMDMRERKEIEAMALSGITDTGKLLAIVETLLDIRDQNETIIKLLTEKNV